VKQHCSTWAAVSGVQQSRLSPCALSCRDCLQLPGVPATAAWAQGRRLLAAPLQFLAPTLPLQAAAALSC
jgi:hypothetical protein